MRPLMCSWHGMGRSLVHAISVSHSPAFDMNALRTQRPNMFNSTPNGDGWWPPALIEKLCPNDWDVLSCKLALYYLMFMVLLFLIVVPLGVIFLVAQINASNLREEEDERNYGNNM